MSQFIVYCYGCIGNLSSIVNLLIIQISLLMKFRSLVQSLISPMDLDARDSLIRRLYNRGSYGLNALDV